MSTQSIFSMTDTWNDGGAGRGSLRVAGIDCNGAVIVMSSLPTSDPASAGQLWNDGGTLKVSAG
jgi:hypothetical protein